MNQNKIVIYNINPCFPKKKKSYEFMELHICLTNLKLFFLSEQDMLKIIYHFFNYFIIY